MRQCSQPEKMRSGRLASAGRNGVKKDYMTLQMHYQEKYKQGIEQEKRQMKYKND